MIIKAISQTKTFLRSMKRFRGRTVHYGCRDGLIENAANIDSIPIDGQDLCCQPWEVSKYCRGSAEIRATHVLERLTLPQTILALRDWYDALKNTGTLHIVVSNMNHSLGLWNSAEWTAESWADTSSPARSAVAGIFGEERDVRRSSYTRELLIFLFSQTKFFGLEVAEKGGDLIVTARRQIGERQVGSTLDDIRADHRARYEYATTLLSDHGNILDIACGVGYGSYILAGKPSRRVEGVDISDESVAYAKTYYSRDNIQFSQADAYLYDWSKGPFDAIVSFETLEHVPDPGRLLEMMSSSLSEEGLLICSTPNEAVMPFTREKFPHHVQHLTPDQFQELLARNGLKVIQQKCQLDKRNPTLLDGWNGSYMIAVCKRSDKS